MEQFLQVKSGEIEFLVLSEGLELLLWLSE